MGKLFLIAGVIDLKRLAIKGFCYHKMTSKYFKLIFIDRVKNTI
jgi:hypothetical protein